MTVPFAWPVRVYYEDTDSGGVVYYAAYLRFMERARTEWLRGLGFEQDQLREEENLLFAVSRIAVDYRKPARFNEQLRVTVGIAKTGGASLTLDQEIFRADGELLISGTAIACIDAQSFKPRSIPKKIQAAFT